ncbi:GNAT family N-acetyltransferase [Pontibacter ramchanderi]|uniref:N-acetyltransferase domain-containing protein n=1 Tax=Pontibacter ramchanderi TaxID=1179743 RepID=A0A2N3U8K4_9BACT|nr:GNAT family N-acetyltransferase [Pontibacter ramchanderi]PKV63054.1 hypothetical protein BD749_2891 [Pontibacter ramchanderi]
MELNITHDKEYQQFTASIGDEEAELAYATPSDEVMDFTHTFVPESARGKGVANKLIEEGLCYAEENGKKVIATCPVVKKFIDRNENYQKLLHA